ncbi:hypothetical protein [Nakamurella lactea]|uniref:hypothetical protein n=1 Tax=Nakamurella lactea TaxID=459515 RepID=UPI000410218E|nr:hypothetical protein [Nakamurella lactea]
MNEQTVIELARRETLDRQQRLSARRPRPRRPLRHRAGETLVRWGNRIGALEQARLTEPQRRLAAVSR